MAPTSGMMRKLSMAGTKSLRICLSMGSLAGRASFQWFTSSGFGAGGISTAAELGPARQMVGRSLGTAQRRAAARGRGWHRTETRWARQPGRSVDVLQPRDATSATRVCARRARASPSRSRRSRWSSRLWGDACVRPTERRVTRAGVCRAAAGRIAITRPPETPRSTWQALKRDRVARFRIGIHLASPGVVAAANETDDAATRWRERAPRRPREGHRPHLYKRSSARPVRPGAVGGPGNHPPTTREPTGS